MKHPKALLSFGIATIAFILIAIFAINRAVSSLSYYGQVTSVFAAWEIIAATAILLASFCIFTVAVIWSVSESRK